MISSNPLIQALQWHLDQGIDVALMDEPVSFFNDAPQDLPAAPIQTTAQQNHGQPAGTPYKAPPLAPAAPIKKTEVSTLNTEQALSKAIDLAKSANSLEKLKETISNFEELTLKRTASNLVFADGHKDARVMIIGEAPGADEDRSGIPFAGESGTLLDKMFAAISLERKSETPANSLYLSNILNWRPPGNRTPDADEIALSLPFIERHIALVNPDFLILSGNTPLKALIKSKGGILKMRGKWQEYTPQTADIQSGTDAAAREYIPALPMLHPTYILNTPASKRNTWNDLLSLKEKLS
jgi:DNA polymerase